MAARRHPRVIAVALVCAGVALLAGCSSGSGNRFVLFPEAHRLTDAARELRKAAGAPAELPRELDKGVLAAYVVEPGDSLLIQPVDLDSPIRLPRLSVVARSSSTALVISTASMRFSSRQSFSNCSRMRRRWTRRLRPQAANTCGK